MNWHLDRSAQHSLALGLLHSGSYTQVVRGGRVVERSWQDCPITEVSGTKLICDHFRGLRGGRISASPYLVTRGEQDPLPGGLADDQVVAWKIPPQARYACHGSFQVLRSFNQDRLAVSGDLKHVKYKVLGVPLPGLSFCP
jgi:hypothetical protein